MLKFNVGQEGSILARSRASRNATFQQPIRVYNRPRHNDNLYTMKEGGDSVVMRREETNVKRHQYLVPSEWKR